jgi:hypothetical protein
MIARGGDVVVAVMGLVAKDFLDHHGIHAEVVHGEDLLTPVVFSELADISVPVAAFFLAPVHDAYPGAIDGTGGANGGRQHLDFAFGTHLAATTGSDKNDTVAARPVLSGAAIEDAGTGVGGNALQV